MASLTSIRVCTTLILVCSVFAIASLNTPAKSQSIPSDAVSPCMVPAPTFASWFTSGIVAANGTVNPADSVNFPATPNCSFYQWSEQMFLWLTSPAPITYGGSGGRVFDSPVFFNVSDLDPATNTRTLQRLGGGGLIRFNLRSAQVGPHGLPVTIDRSGKLLEIRPIKVGPAGGAIIPDESGRLVEVANIKVGENGLPIFLDKSGTQIRTKRGPGGNPLVLDKFNKPVEISALKFGLNRPIFLDPSGNVIGFEQGQAGSNGVLMAQNGSLVYYAMFVNDVYASFMTGTKTSGIVPVPTQFPTTMTELAKITAFNGGNTFPDANALCVEVKTAWVETTGLDVSKYVTMTAMIPTYDKANPSMWVPNGTKSAQLALVGLHVAGSTAQHPEMIWATFEHMGNTPNAAYTYNATSGIRPVSQDTSGTWLFCATNSMGPFNQEHMKVSGSNIVPAMGFSIGPSDTIRWKAWGAASDQDPNPLAQTPESNSDIISMNNSVLGQLIAGDVRKNYLLTGATWTVNGLSTGAQVGTSKMCNTTMETYQQGTDNTSAHGGLNCFDCHQGNMLGDSSGNGLSHIFGTLKP